MRAPWTSGVLVRAAVLGGWIALCDLWLKVVARVGACPDAGGLSQVVQQPLDVPPACAAMPLVGDAVILLPAASNGGPLGLLGSTLSATHGPLWALAVLALASTVSILVGRWRYRDPGDAHALAALWAGSVTLAVPRVLGGGSGLTEIAIGGMPTGIGELAVLWSLLWLAWRAIAEARA